jgi:translocon-associated protein subunit beta
MQFIIFASILVAGAFASDLESQAKLLATKMVANNFLVQNRDLTIKYNIYNVGTNVANKVKLVDNTFPSTDFARVLGQLSVEWRSIPPNGNVTHVVVLKPLQSGYFNFTSAELSYIPSEDAEPQQAYTSFPGEGGIMTEMDFARKHSPHLLEWAIFGLMCTPSLIIPYLLWYRSQCKYASASAAKLKN